LPKNLFLFKGSANEADGGFTSTLEKDDAKFAPVFLNVGLFKKRANNVLNNGKTKYRQFSDGSANGAFYHELGHFYRGINMKFSHSHYENSFKETCYGVDGKKTEVFRKIKFEVFSYASTGYDEFVAEVFCVLTCGQDFDSDAMDLYEKLDGPPEWRAIRAAIKDSEENQRAA
jgi:hypothetical protein